MLGRRGQSEPSGLRINGHRLIKETGRTKTATPEPATPGTDQETTRYLSAATQRDIEFARSVVDEVVNEKFRALAPTYGVDVAVVAMWAIKAVRTRVFRDYTLAGALTVFLIFLILLPLCHWLLILIPLPLIAAWLTVSWEHWECIHNVVIRKMLRDRFKLSDAPAPPQEADRERLQEIRKRRDGNLAVFSGHSAFIGSGIPTLRNRLLLDVSRGKDTKDGSPGDPQPFSAHDLHMALVVAFDHKTGLGKNLHTLKVYERLFVNGKHIWNDSQLLPDRYRPPPTSVDAGLLEAATLHPSPEARTYVCVEMPGWQGQLVVTLFVRAVHAGGSLFVEWTFQVLPPLRAKFLAIDGCYEQSRKRQLKNSLLNGLRTMTPALLKSPYWAIRSSRQLRISQRSQSRQSEMISKGYVFDYGARHSIREVACGRQRQHYFLARDESMYMLLAEKTLTRTVRTFLIDHGVDLSEFDEQIKVIFDNSINVGNIDSSSGVVIGNQSSATVTNSSKGQSDSKSG